MSPSMVYLCPVRVWMDLAAAVTDGPDNILVQMYMEIGVREFGLLL